MSVATDDFIDGSTKKGRKKVVARVQGGLGNRLRCLISAIYLVDRFDFSLILCWMPDEECECQFHDLFDNDFELAAIPSGLSLKEFYEQLLDGPIHYYGKGALNNPDLAYLATIPDQESKINRDGHIVYDSDTILEFIDPDTRATILHSLKIKDGIISNADDFCARHRIGRQTYGVHIRRTDAATKEDDYFVSRMDAIVSQDPSARFFVCSDSKEAEDKIAASYPGRVVTRPKDSYVKKRDEDADWRTAYVNGDTIYNVHRDRRSVVEALEDLLILTRTSFSIRSEGSFSSVAEWWVPGAADTCEAWDRALAKTEKRYRRNQFTRDGLEIQGHLYPIRLTTGFGHLAKKQLIIQARIPYKRHKLDETAFEIFQRCDGTRTVDQIAQSIQELRPRLSRRRVLKDVLSALSGLEKKSLVSFRTTQTYSVPVVTVRFRGFWRGFDPEENYFLRLMSKRMLAIVTNRGVPDVEFRSTLEKDSRSDGAAEPASVQVFVSDERTKPDLDKFDYAFSPFEVDEEYAARHSRIPYEEYAVLKRVELRQLECRRFAEFLFPVDIKPFNFSFTESKPKAGDSRNIADAAPSARLERHDRASSFVPPYHVFLTVDDAHREGLFALVNSIRLNTATPEKFFFHVLVDGPTEDYETAFAAMGADFQFETLSFTSDARCREYANFLDSNIFVRGGTNEPRRITNLMNFSRFFLPDIFPDVDIGLYLDVDMIVQTDLARIFDTDLSSAFIASPLNRSLEDYHSGLNLPAVGFNAGLLLINFARWREENVIDAIKQVMALHKKHRIFGGGTQPILNTVFARQCLKLNKLWNVTNLGTDKQLDPSLLKSAWILHWNGTFKPWLKNGRYKHLWKPYRPPTLSKPNRKKKVFQFASGIALIAGLIWLLFAVGGAIMRDKSEPSPSGRESNPPGENPVVVATEVS